MNKIGNVLYCSDTGGDRGGDGTLDDTTARIKHLFSTLGIDPTLVLGLKTPVEIAFAITTTLSSVKKAIENCIVQPEETKTVVGFNAAPRKEEGVVDDSKGEYLKHFSIDGNEFYGYGEEIAKWCFLFAGKVSGQVETVIGHGGIKNTSEGSQFRSLEYLIPIISDALNLSQEELEGAQNTESEEVRAKNAPEQIFLAAEEFYNNRVIVKREWWDEIKNGTEFKITNKLTGKKTKSITDMEIGEIGIWESSNKLGGDLVVLDIAYKRDVTKDDNNEESAIALTKELNEKYKPGDDASEIFTIVENAA
jgi:hypothetical protein